MAGSAEESTIYGIHAECIVDAEVPKVDSPTNRVGGILGEAVNTDLHSSDVIKPGRSYFGTDETARNAQKTAGVNAVGC